MPKVSVKAFPEVGSVEISKFGERKRGFEGVQNYLKRFGYLQEGSFKSTEIDTATSEALRRYQDRNGLPTTGEFDETTKSEMVKHRCGLPDMVSGVDFATTCAWIQRGFTYAFRNGTNDIVGESEFQAVRNAFRTWAAIVPLTFTEVGVDGYHDIEIDWRDAHDPDHSMVGGVLAHSDFPQGCGVVTNNFPKPLHYDDSENVWSIGAVSGSFDVETVALHEIGHIIGLAHSSVTGAVMYPSVSDNFTLRVLRDDDIAGVRRQYAYEPAVAAWGSNRLDIFGLGTDWAMYHKAWDGSWHPSVTDWERLGGVFYSPPAVTAWGSNRLDIFGLGTDWAMYHKAWDGSWHPSVTDWERLGGIFTSPPAVTAWGSNRLDIFGLGTDWAMYHKAWDGSWHPSVTDWERLGGIFTSPPAVTAWGSNRLDIFGLGTDGSYVTIKRGMELAPIGYRLGKTRRNLHQSAGCYCMGI